MTDSGEDVIELALRIGAALESDGGKYFVGGIRTCPRRLW